MPTGAQITATHGRSGWEVQIAGRGGRSFKATAETLEEAVSKAVTAKRAADKVLEVERELLAPAGQRSRAEHHDLLRQIVRKKAIAEAGMTPEELAERIEMVRRARQVRSIRVERVEEQFVDDDGRYHLRVDVVTDQPADRAIMAGICRKGVLVAGLPVGTQRDEVAERTGAGE